MKKYFATASSLERRFLIGSLLVVFVVLNWIFVWPLFSDWSKFQKRREDSQRTLKIFEDAIAEAEKLKLKVAVLEGEGMSVPPEDQTVSFMTTILSQAAASGVTILTSLPQQQRTTNQFFVERAQALTISAQEQQLVDFLYNLGTGDSLVRVRGLSLNPDQPHFNLSASLTLVASFQKKVSLRAAALTTTNASAPVVKPAPAPADKLKAAATVKSNQPAASRVSKLLTPTKK
jgi:hypothetical protein